MFKVGVWLLEPAALSEPLDSEMPPQKRPSSERARHLSPSSFHPRTSAGMVPAK